MRVYQDDDALVESAIRGDRCAFEALIDKYQAFVFNIAMKFVGNQRELAEEITQDAFVKVFKNLAAYKRASKFSTWLYRITYTTSMDEARKRKSLVVSDDFNEEFAHVASPEDWDVSGYDASYLKRELNKALQTLSAIDSTIITLFYLNEQSVEEICSTLDMERSAVKVRLFRARKKIKDALINKSIREY